MLFSHITKEANSKILQKEQASCGAQQQNPVKIQPQLITILHLYFFLKLTGKLLHS